MYERKKVTEKGESLERERQRHGVGGGFDASLSFGLFSRLLQLIHLT